MSLARLPLGRQLTLTVAAVSGIALLLSSLAFMAYDRVSFARTQVRRLMTEAEIVGYNSATALLFEDPGAAGTTLAALRADLSVVSAAIYTTDGRLFAAYAVRDGAAPPALEGALLPGPAQVSGGSHVVVSWPIVFEGSRLGTLVIRSDLRERSERLRRYAGIVAVVSLAALLVAMLAGAALQRLVRGPILGLAEVARGVSDRNDFSRRAPSLERRDELGVLVTAFNQMLDGLQRRDAQLREAQAELERRLEERTQLLRQAEEASRVKDEFLATLSHELRTPLNAVVGWAALLVQGPLEDELHDRAVAAIDRNARAQVKLISDVLDVSRIVSGKLSLRVEQVDLRLLAQQAIDALSHAAAAKQIQVSLESDPALEPILGDQGRLQQVLWNLLSNAIKFTNRDGHVAVRLRRAGSDVEIEVEDDGIGVPPEFLPHVFERFRQADSSTTRAHGGLGLGLAIVRHLVEMHGGTTRVESAGPGRGAKFVVTLPPIPVAPSAGEAVPAVPVTDGE